MTDLRQRLIASFCAVFLDLSKAEVPGASMHSVAGWDSLATVTLIAAIEKEFGVQIRSDDLDQLVSFDSILTFLQGKATAKVA
jgi:acyl carrier protein